MSVLKIFAKPADVTAVAADARVVATYDAFVVIEAGEADARALARRFPLEDITSQYRLPVGGAEADSPGATPRARGAKRAAKAAALSAGPHHYLVQFIGPVKKSWVAALRKAGATLRHPTGGFGHVVRADAATLQRIRALPSVRWVGHVPYADRVAPGLLDAGARAAAAPVLPRRRTVPGVVTVEVYGADVLAAVARAARRLGFTVCATDERAVLLTLESDAAAAKRREQIRALSAVHGVRYIRERVIPRTSNNVATGLMGNAYAAVSASGLKLTGDGEIVAVCDTGIDSGDAADIHPDFAGRVVAIKSYPITADWAPFITNPAANDGAADLDSGHGTHVAGSVLGDGSASAADGTLIRGHATKARLVFQAVEQEMLWRPSAPPRLRSQRYVLAGIPLDMEPLFRFAYDHGARIHSNSWGGGDPGAYDTQCRQFDEFVWTHKDLCIVVAAGNDGTDEDGDGAINPTSVTSPGTAKNCITVGACENRRPEFNDETYGEWWPRDYPVAPFADDPMANNDRQVVAFSSRGPTSDGRFKPDVVAPGTFVLSTRSTRIAPNNFAWAAYPPNRLYFHMGGTSMATPLASGALALIREHLRRALGIASPSAALLKAVLVAGAERLPRTALSGSVVDNHQGYGRIELDRSLKRLLLAAEGAGLETGQLATHTLQLTTASRTLRIALAYSDFPGTELVNNLNLIITGPSGRRYVGNQRNTSGNAMALDGRNNVELVHARKAAKGNWTIEVVASNVTRGPQDYALAAVLV